MLLLYALSKSLEYHSKTSKYGVNVGNEKKTMNPEYLQKRKMLLHLSSLVCELYSYSLGSSLAK